MNKVWIILLILTALNQPKLAGQSYFRVKADFSVKSKYANGNQELTMGKVSYDRNTGQIIYHLNFPQKELWITVDTLIYRIRDNKLISKTFTPAMAQFSVFHLALNSHLQDFGLKSSQYHLKEVNREGEMVISTWSPPESLSDKLGNILVSAMDKRLYGVVFMDVQDSVLRKQFFTDYIITNGLAFPGKITEIFYAAGKESYQITTFRNILIDEQKNDLFYNYPLDRFR